jgi:hypothetical protein
MPLSPERFSRRFDARPTPEPRQPHEVPHSAKTKLVSAIDRLRQRSLPGATSLGPRLADALGKPFDSVGSMASIRALILDLEWWEFYDACEELLRLSRQASSVVVEIEAIFAEEALPYRFTESGIEWRLPQPATQAIRTTAQLLVFDEQFRGPAEQWAKAEAHLNRRPPDPENCIKDAVGALEGVARIISGRRNDTLSQILPSLATSLGIHGTIKQALASLYAYRGDQQAIAHGAVEELDNVIPEAELVLHWTAAAIMFLTKKSRLVLLGHKTGPSTYCLTGCGKTFPGAPKGQIRCPAEPGINNLHG